MGLTDDDPRREFATSAFRNKKPTKASERVPCHLCYKPLQGEDQLYDICPTHDQPRQFRSFAIAKAAAETAAAKVAAQEKTARKRKPAPKKRARVASGRFYDREFVENIYNKMMSGEIDGRTACVTYKCSYRSIYAGFRRFGFELPSMKRSRQLKVSRYTDEDIRQVHAFYMSDPNMTLDHLAQTIGVTEFEHLPKVSRQTLRSLFSSIGLKNKPRGKTGWKRLPDVDGWERRDEVRQYVRAHASNYKSFGMISVPQFGKMLSHIAGEDISTPEKITEARLRRDWSLSNHIHAFTGISTITIRKIERGEPVNAHNLVAVAFAFKLLKPNGKESDSSEVRESKDDLCPTG